MVKLAAPHPTSAAVVRTSSSAIRDLLEITERPEVISLAGGLPSPAAFPVAELAEASAAVLAADPTGALQYGPTEGYRPLRTWIAERQGCAVGEVLVTNGSQQALELLARATLDPGDVVALADPGYIGAIQAFKAAGAELAAVPSDGDGLRVDLLAERLDAGLRPTLVYVVANFDNPSGHTLSADRRIALAALADRHGFWVVDDDPYGSLRWAGTPGVPLRSLTDRTIWLGSTSKVLCPGLRIGWAVAPPALLRSLTLLKQAADLHTGSLAQRLAHHVLVRPGFLEAHLEGLRARYQGQADVLVGALRDRLGDRLAFHAPEGGMFVWGELADPAIDTADLLPRAVEAGVAYVPGAAFSVADPHRSSLRMSFATGRPDELVEAVDRLAGVLGA